MGVLRVLCARGDEETTFSPRHHAQAQKLYDEMVKKGFGMFRHDGDGAVTKISAFDPNAEEIVSVPRMVGG